MLTRKIAVYKFSNDIYMIFRNVTCNIYLTNNFATTIMPTIIYFDINQKTKKRNAIEAKNNAMSNL